MKEFRVLMDEAVERVRTRTRKHKTSRSSGDTHSRMEGTRSAKIPELGCDLAAASITTRQAWYWALLDAGKPVDERYLCYDFASLMTVLQKTGIDTSVGLAEQERLFAEVCAKAAKMSSEQWRTSGGRNDPTKFSEEQRAGIYKGLIDSFLHEHIENPGLDEARKTNEYREDHIAKLGKIKQTGPVQEYHTKFMAEAQKETFYRDPLHKDRIVAVFVEGLIECFKVKVQMIRNESDLKQTMACIDQVIRECRKLEGMYQLQVRSAHPDFYKGWFSGEVEIIVNSPDREIAVACKHRERQKSTPPPQETRGRRSNPRSYAHVSFTWKNAPYPSMSEERRASVVEKLLNNYRDKAWGRVSEKDKQIATRQFFCNRCGWPHEWRSGKIDSVTCKQLQEITGWEPRLDRAKKEKKSYEGHKQEVAARAAQVEPVLIEEIKNGDEEPRPTWDPDSDASINVTIGGDVAMVGMGTFCYVDGAHAALSSPPSWPERLEAPPQVHRPELSMPKYFGAFVYTMLTIVNVVAQWKSLGLDWISWLVAGITYRDVACVVATLVVVGTTLRACHMCEGLNVVRAEYRVVNRPLYQVDQLEEEPNQPMVEVVDGFARVSFATDGTASCSMVTEYKADEAIAYNSYVEHAKKVRRKVLDRDQAKPPISRHRVCLTWFAAALYRKTCEPQGVLVTPVLFDNCANRAFMNYQFFLHLYKRGYITQLDKYTVDRFCNGSCGGKGRIWGWCILTLCTGHQVFEWCFEIVVDLGLDMILGCRFMEIASTTICYHDKMIYTRITNFAHEQQPKPNELPQVTVGYPQDGCIPDEPRQFAQICFSKEEALYRQEFTVESMSRVTCPPKKINGDKYMKKAFTLRTFANYSVANVTI